MTSTTTYRIETKDSSGRWSSDVEAYDGANRFDSEAEAEAAIESLRKLGDEWADAEYRVVTA